MHRLFNSIILHNERLRRSVENNKLFELVEEHVANIMRHQIHVQESELRSGRSLVNFHQSLLIVHSTVLIEPRVQVLHRSESKCEGMGRLSPNQRVERRRLLDRGHCTQKAVPATDVQLMQ